MFIAWLEATTDGEAETAEFIYEGMPERPRIATDAWLAEEPFDNPDAPSSPFVMEEYVVPAAQIADDLAQMADEHTLTAQQASERANEYVLTTVLSPRLCSSLPSAPSSTAWSTGGRSYRSP